MYINRGAAVLAGTMAVLTAAELSQSSLEINHGDAVPIRYLANHGGHLR